MIAKKDIPVGMIRPAAVVETTITRRTRLLLQVRTDIDLPHYLALYKVLSIRKTRHEAFPVVKIGQLFHRHGLLLFSHESQPVVKPAIIQSFSDLRSNSAPGTVQKPVQVLLMKLLCKQAVREDPPPKAHFRSC